MHALMEEAHGLAPEIITHLISPQPRRSLVLLPQVRIHRPLQQEDVDANLALVNCGFEVFPDREPSQYELAASIVRLDWHLSGELLTVKGTGEQLGESVEAPSVCEPSVQQDRANRLACRRG